VTLISWATAGVGAEVIVDLARRFHFHSSIAQNKQGKMKIAYHKRCSSARDRVKKTLFTLAASFLVVFEPQDRRSDWLTARSGFARPDEKDRAGSQPRDAIGNTADQ
jgi:hypothetical protein